MVSVGRRSPLAAAMRPEGTEGAVGWAKRPEVRRSRAEKRALEALARRYSAPFGLVVRARIVLLAAENVGTGEIAARLGFPRQLVLKWLHRFVAERVQGLVDRPRPGRPRRRRTAVTTSPLGSKARDGRG